MLTMADFMDSGSATRSTSEKGMKRMKLANGDDFVPSLKWVGKKRTHKDKWEEEKQFRERFIKEGLPVRKCTVIRYTSEGEREKRISDMDLEYNPR